MKTDLPPALGPVIMENSLTSTKRRRVSTDTLERRDGRRRTAFEVDVVGDEVDPFLHFETRVASFFEEKTAGTTLKDSRLDVRDGSGEGGSGETGQREGQERRRRGAGEECAPLEDVDVRKDAVERLEDLAIRGCDAERRVSSCPVSRRVGTRSTNQQSE
jgi:hypothetical protein